MHNLGQTRSSQRLSYLLLTSDTFVRAPLPGMRGCTAIVHVGPALGAGFTEYTAEFETDGEIGPTVAQRFAYVIEGSLKVEIAGRETELSARGYAFFPKGMPHRMVASARSRVAVIEKPYEALPSVEAPCSMASHEDAISSHPLADDPKAVVVEVEAVRQLPHAVSLARIKADPGLGTWDLVRLPRLSVMPVTPAQWERIQELSRKEG